MSRNKGNNQNPLYGTDIPLGLGMAMAQNFNALSAFAALSENDRYKIIDGAKNVRSKSEMREYVNSLGKNSAF